MELSKQQKLIDRKFANNTGELPGFKFGNIPGLPGDVQRVIDNVNNLEKPVKTVDVGNAVGGAFGTLQNIVGSFSNYQSTDEIMAEYKPTQANTAGIGWTKLVHAKDGKLPGYVGGAVGNILGATGAGAAAGSIVPGIGTAIGAGVGFLGSTIGSIFSSNKQKENERKAANYVQRYNNFSMEGAISTARQIEDERRYGNQFTQPLFNHKDGKVPGFVNGLASATGPVNGEATAKVSNGEVIANKILGTMYRVPGVKNNKDGKLASLNNSDTVITNKYGLSDYAWRTGDIEGAEKMMMMFGKPSYKCGKLPGHAEGWLGNAIPAFLGGIAGLGQYLDAKNSRPYYPNTYAANPYETESLTTLAGLRVNPYPVMSQLRNAEARTNRAIDIAGGLSGSQRTAARLANLNTTQNNIANVLANIQQQNNAYKSSYAQAALNAGQQNRQARMSANQWDLDYYSKAHAARNRGMQTGIANMLSQIQQYQANEFKRRQFNETMQLYRDDMDQRQKNMNYIQNLGTRGIGYYPMYYDPTSQRTPITPAQYEKWYKSQGLG